MKRELPTYNIEGTEFVVDAAGLRLYEKANPDNAIPLSDMRDVGDGYTFDYSPREKNLPSIYSDDREISTVKIPEFVKLDPEGMADKYSCPLDGLSNLNDFDLIVDQEALQRRLYGQLPTVDIAGHTFYVDIRMDMLRPKDDFLSSGIELSSIDNFYEESMKAYVIPYDPKTHEMREPDYDNLTAIPKDLIVTSFAHESKLDPIGFNRKHGFDELSGLKETNVCSHFEAKVIDWKDTGIEETIRRNLKKQTVKQADENPGKIGRRRKGRRL